MQTMSVNGYDMAYLDVGRGTDNSPPLLLVHGTLGDFRTWNAVLGPLSRKHRVIALSLRRFFPEHWDGIGSDYLMAQHIADVIGFIEELNAGPVDLIGHSRGGHIGFRVAQTRPDLLRKTVLAEPGGDLEPALQPDKPVTRPRAAGTARSDRSRDGRERRHRWRARTLRRWHRRRRRVGALACRAKQQLRDNVHTLLGQVGENRKPFQQERSRVDQDADAADRRRRHERRVVGDLARAGRTYSGRKDRCHPGTRHWMFEQAPQEFCDVVLDFLKA